MRGRTCEGGEAQQLHLGIVIVTRPFKELRICPTIHSVPACLLSYLYFWHEFLRTSLLIIACADAIVSACVTLHMHRKRTICWLDSTRLDWTGTIKGGWNKSLAWHLNGIRVTKIIAWILFIILSICEPWMDWLEEESVCQAVSQSCTSCHDMVDSFWLPFEWSTAHQFEEQLSNWNPKNFNILFHRLRWMTYSEWCLGWVYWPTMCRKDKLNSFQVF